MKAPLPRLNMAPPRMPSQHIRNRPRRTSRSLSVGLERRNPNNSIPLYEQIQGRGCDAQEEQESQDVGERGHHDGGGHGRVNAHPAQ